MKKSKKREEVLKALEIEQTGEHIILPCALCKNHEIDGEKCFNGKSTEECPIYNAYTYGDNTTYLFDPTKIK